MSKQEAWSGAGMQSMSDVQDLMKALEAQEGITDVANLVSVGALQPQSLEGTLALLTFQEKHLTLWRDIPKGTANSTLEEYSVQTGYGQEGGWVGQMETPVEGDPLFKRKTASVKFLRELWKISDVSGMVTTIRDTEVAAKQAASLRCLRNINRTLYSGDSDMIPESIDGFDKTISNNGSSDHVKDLRGVVPTQNDFRELTELIVANYGTAEGAGLYCSPGGITTLDQILETVGSSTAQRFNQGNVGADGGISLGWGVKAINTSFGKIIPKTDIFIASEYEGRGVPKRANPSNPEATIEGKTSDRSPDTPAISVATNAATANSLWAASGIRPAVATYQYRVAAGNRYGLSAACAADDAGADVVAGGDNTITVTPGVTSAYPATYYEVYSEQAEADGLFRLCGRVADSGAATTDFVDLNATIPGTTKMFLLDLTTVGELRTFTLKRLAPMHSKEYARINNIVPSHSNVCRKFSEFRETLNSLAVDNPEPSLRNKEGATTIPYGSTLQVNNNNGSGSTEHPEKDDDIVWSCKKLQAVA